MRGIKKILVSVLITLTANVFAQTESLSLVSPGEDWVINLNSRIGATTRIKATQQDPLPFCFATAASMLWDQQRCMIDRKDCREQTPSSFLAAVPAGQNFNLGSELDIKNGGSPLLSLNYIAKNGVVEYSNCNYSQINPQGSNIEYQLSLLESTRFLWLRYRDYTPYLERFYRKEFTKTLQNINSQISESQAEIILNIPLSISELGSILLINPSCWNQSKKDDRFIVKFTKIGNKSNARYTFETINKLLSEKKPVIINFCTRIIKGRACLKSDYHSAIIIARTIANHSITGDRKTVYWMVNSWGEKWQNDNRDGWIFADTLLNGINGELIWLDLK